MRVILEANTLLCKAKDRTSATPFYLACETEDQDTIMMFLRHSNKICKIATGLGPERMSALHLAACKGNYNLALFLMDEFGAKVTAKDKFKRSPLTMAVRNGHARLASLLLQRGADWNHPDSSNNTPLHYAAGAGFIECIDVLIRHGAKVNADNIWKCKPITIAMLMNHSGTVKRLL